MNSPTLRVACLYFPGGLGADLAPAYAEACLRFTPQLALRSDEAVFLEIGGCRHLYDEAGFARRALALGRRFGREPRVTVAATATLAWIKARYEQNETRHLPLKSLADFADPFLSDPALRREAFRKKLTQWIMKLEDLGVHTVLDFTRLPPQSLTSRFGVEAAWISRRITQQEDAVWPRFTPPERILEREELQHPETMESAVVSLEGALFGLKRVIDRTMARLKAHGLRLAALKLVFRLERSPDRVWKIELPFPQGSTLGLVPILRDRLDHELQRDPLVAPIQVIEMQVTDTAPGHGAQNDFFEGGTEEREALDSLMGRLASRLGPKKAFRARAVDRYLPENAWIPAFDSATQEATSAVAVGAPVATTARSVVARPSRLLKQPELLALDGQILHSRRRGRRWHIREWIGPERISGEWWRITPSPSVVLPLSPPVTAAPVMNAAPDLRGGFSRDYYQTLTEEGETLWIYATPDAKWYLHGYFD